jgi:flagellar basal-body rod protein FlgF
MNRGLYSGVEAMTAAEKRLDVIAGNLANLSVNGYKRRSASTASFESALAGRVERHIATRTTVDWSQGAIEATGNDFDLALHGKGFLAVETPTGEAYSRGGSMRLDPEGVLVTREGYPLAWEGGRGRIDPLGESVRIDAEGFVWQSDEQVGQLKLANFARLDGLRRDSQGYLHAPATLKEAAHEVELRQGYVERSNASAVDEMIALVSTQRSYESAARLMSSIEQGYRRLTAR